MIDARLWRRFDWWLLLAILLLNLYGVAMIFSATLGTPDLTDLPRKQVIYIGLGLVVYFVMAATNYRDLGHTNRLLYALVIILLLIALALGSSQIGSVQRWVSLPWFDIQPAEPVKILFILVMARFLADHEEDITHPGTVLRAFTLVALPTALVFAQPNLSTAIVLVVTWAAMMFVAGWRWTHIATFGGVGLVTIPASWLLLHDYMRKRILLFLGLTSEVGARFNIDQALISIGNGGLTGRGFASGSQSQLHFLRVRHTDFIFSVVAEELGLIGAACLLALFMLLLFRLLRIAHMSLDAFGRYYIVGLVAMIFFTAAINIAMNLSLTPVAGLPLPFISYGGSSLLTLLFGLGVAESIAMRYKPFEF